MELNRRQCWVIHVLYSELWITNICFTCWLYVYLSSTLDFTAFPYVSPCVFTHSVFCYGSLLHHAGADLEGGTPGTRSLLFLQKQGCAPLIFAEIECLTVCGHPGVGASLLKMLGLPLLKIPGSAPVMCCFNTFLCKKYHCILCCYITQSTLT